MHGAANDDEEIDGSDGHPITTRHTGAAAAITGEEDVVTMLEGVEIDALFGSADEFVLQCPPNEQGEHRSYEDGEATECKLGNSISGDEITRDGIMGKNSFDELFDEPAWPSPSHTQNLEPSPPVAPNASPLQHSIMPELDLPTVMANISMLKNSIVSNHLLLTRFLNLQSTYRTLSARLTNERHLYEQAQLTINSMREKIDSVPLLQSQVTELKEELQKEHSIRITSETTITQHQKEIKELKNQMDMLKKDKASAERRLAESLKELGGLKLKIVTLMGENRSLVNQIIQLDEQELARDNSRLQGEVIDLRSRITHLEALNIRLRAGRSILAGGEGNTLADFQSLRPVIHPTTPTTTSSPTQSPVPQPRLKGSTVPTAPNSCDDEVIFMGTNLSPSSATLHLS